MKNSGKVEFDFFVLKTNNNEEEPYRLAVNPSQVSLFPYDFIHFNI